MLNQTLHSTINAKEFSTPFIDRFKWVFITRYQKQMNWYEIYPCMCRNICAVHTTLEMWNFTLVDIAIVHQYCAK